MMFYVKWGSIAVIFYEAMYSRNHEPDFKIIVFFMPSRQLKGQKCL